MFYYKALGLPEAQLRQIDQMPLVHSSGMLWLGRAGVLLFLGYLFWIKKYFSEARLAGGSPE